MRWPAPVIAALALDAGFSPDDAATAVAIALAVSGGDDLFRFTAGAKGAGDWRGLWAINVDLYPQTRVFDMTRPTDAARAARALTVECGGFGWSPVFRTGTHVPYLLTARAAVGRPDRAPRVVAHPVAPSDPGWAARIGDGLRLIGRRAESITNLGRR